MNFTTIYKLFISKFIRVLTIKGQVPLNRLNYRQIFLVYNFLLLPNNLLFIKNTRVSNPINY